MPSAEITDTWGAMFISFALDGILYGVGVLLALQYFTRFPKDPWSLKCLIGVMLVLVTVHYGSMFGMNYWLLISDFDNLEEMNVMPRTALSQLLAIYFLAFCSQCFFASRIWRISHGNVVLVAWVMALALLQISAGIAQTVAAGLVGFWNQLGSTEKITTTQSAATAACDLSITVILCWLLWEKRTGIKKTDTLLQKLIVLSLNRGALTTLAATLNMSLFVWRPSLFIFMIPLLPSGHLYIISVTTTLLFRATARENLVHEVTTGQTLPLTAIGFGHGPQSGNVQGPSLASSARTSPRIGVTKSIITWNEAELGPQEESQEWDRKNRHFLQSSAIQEELTEGDHSA